MTELMMLLAVFNHVEEHGIFCDGQTTAKRKAWLLHGITAQVEDDGCVRTISVSGQGCYAYSVMGEAVRHGFDSTESKLIEVYDMFLGGK